MVNYRRNRVEGGSYFFTVTLRDRCSKILSDYVLVLREVMQKVAKENPWETKAIVILPDHIHALWELPEGDSNYAIRWRKIKSYFTKSLLRGGKKLNKNEHGEYDLWQRRYWEHTIRDEKDYESHVNYIHYNPVKHGLVERVKDWPYSSFHRYVKGGFVSADWGGDQMTDMKQVYGE